MLELITSTTTKWVYESFNSECIFPKVKSKNHHNCFFFRFAFYKTEHFQKSISLIMHLNFHLIDYKSSPVVFLFEVSCFCLHQAPFQYLSIPPILLLDSVFIHPYNENMEKCVRLGFQM